MKSVTIVKAYDHFSTHVRTDHCYFQAIGEVIGEDEIYLHLLSTKIFCNDPKDEPEEKIIKIVKSAIIERIDTTLEEH